MADKNKTKIKILAAKGLVRVNGMDVHPPVSLYVETKNLKRTIKSLNQQGVPSVYILVGAEEIKAGKKNPKAKPAKEKDNVAAKNVNAQTKEVKDVKNENKDKSNDFKADKKEDKKKDEKKKDNK